MLTVTLLICQIRNISDYITELLYNLNVDSEKIKYIDKMFTEFYEKRDKRTGEAMTEITKKELSLNFVWGIRLSLRAEGDKLWAEGDKLWAEAILSVYGNIEMEWKNWSEEKQSHECHLETGEVFYPL